MRIEINPQSLKNLKDICEVLYKLHPYVLDNLIKINRTIGNVLGTIDLTNMTLAEREFLTRSYEEEETKSNIPKEEETVSIVPMEDDVPTTKPTYTYIIKCLKEDIKRKEMDELNELNKTNDKGKLLKKIQELKEDDNSRRFDNLRTFIQLDTYEYIPMKISVEIEDPVIGRKVKELVEALEKTRAPEQFYYNKKEMDEDAYFAEGYEFTMNKEQKKQRDEFLDKEDVESLEKLLRKEKLYP